ncbi:MAG: MarR family transcriptional regulator [Pseudonocardia sp.]|uniref:MarR family winged helix-turn-helix transcriptional regulator n=1 Tax=Pseudonocardia sp. TaxID=60912 RepID=UPI001ACFAE91|nr:MarR family transcriptional regulator [Pseudonocardia sp.]MBN9100659.1 MarR family transcriptional regulator [Pseudonocardia sp.]
MRTSTTQPVDVIELQTAVLRRNVEMVRRRGEVYVELDPAEYLLLRTLDDLGPMDIRTLASAVGVDPSTAGRQIGAMHAAGFVDRAPAAEDRRRTIISVTVEGLRRTEAVRDRRRENIRELLEDWSPEDLETLGVMFGRYNAAVSDRYVTHT